MNIGEWLWELQVQDGEYNFYWPHTPVGNLQAEAWRRCGASDYNLKSDRCRAWMILKTLQEMDENGLLPHPFSALDLCCGDGIVLMQIGKFSLSAQCYGVDLLRYPTHQIAETRGGVQFYKVSLQQIVRSKPPAVVDVCIMLNTFRGWNKADLPTQEHDIPQKTLAWMHQNCRYVFLTVSQPQVDWLKREGWFVWDVGPGEDDSRLICGFPCEGPEGPSGLWKP